MSWYGQKAAGHWRANRATVELLLRKARFPPPEKQQAETYTRFVTDEVKLILSEGFQGWIAPEAHIDDPYKHDQWVWKFANTNHMLEAIYTYDPRLTPHDIHELCKNNKGRGWRFPQIYIFDTDPSFEHMTILRDWKVPFGIESELRDEVVEPPVENWKKRIHARIDILASAARTLKDIIDEQP